MKRSSQLVFLLFFATIIPLGIAIAIIISEQRETLAAHTRETHLALTQALTSAVQNTIQQTRHDLAITGAVLNTSPFSENEALAFLNTQFHDNALIHSVGIYSTAYKRIETLTKQPQLTTDFPDTLPATILKNISRPNESGKNTPITIWWTQQRSKPVSPASTSTEQYLPDASRQTDESSDTTYRMVPFLPITTSVQGERFSGYLLVLLSEKYYLALLHNIALQAFGVARGAIHCVDSECRLIASTEIATADFPPRYNDRTLEKGLLESRLKTQFYHHITNVLRSSEAIESVAFGTLFIQTNALSQEYTNANNEEVFATVTGIPLTNLSIIIEQPQSVVYQPLTHLRLRSFFVASAMALVMIIGGIVWQYWREKRSFAYINTVDGKGTIDAEEGNIATLSETYYAASKELEQYRRMDVKTILLERNTLEVITRQAKDGVLIIAPNKTVMLANDTFAGFLRKDPITLENRGISEVLQDYPTLLEQIESMFSTLRQGSEQLRTTDLTIMFPAHTTERIFHLILNGCILDRQFIALVLRLTDVTQEREAERIKTDIVAFVAHELRTPLSTILGISEAIASGKITEQSEIQMFTQHIATQSTRLRDIINDFLDISRIESGKFQRNAEPCNIREIIFTTIDLNMQLATAKDILVEYSISPDIALVKGDAQLLGQVVTNLFSNACKYSELGKTLQIEAYNLDETSVYLAFHDQGYGIAPEAQERLFTKFFRNTDDTRVGAEIGTGLGLAYIKEIVEQYGGSIGVQSMINVGSTFWLKLPRFSDVH